MPDAKASRDAPRLPGKPICSHQIDSYMSGIALAAPDFFGYFDHQLQLGSGVVHIDHLAIAAAGVPLEQLVSLAGDHAANVTGVVDRAIALFEEHVKGTPGAESDEELTEVVRALLPPVTRLVAQHFHRSLVTRALERVADGDRQALADALVAADAENLKVTCEWR